VDAVRAVAPEATGMAVDIVEFGHTTVRSLHEALAAALVLIALLLWLLWRNASDVMLALAPLLLAATLTVATVAAFDIRFNFANVIVLPLLLGIGVDSGIHLVHRARSAPPGDWNLLGDTTARAVFYSAITTITSFGSLALSSHRGVASLGIVLTIAIGYTLLCNLVALPALLAVVGGGSHSRRRT
jgi:predicted RND superfamily exporter protein